MSKKLHNLESNSSPLLNIKAADEPKFLMVDTIIWDKLSPYALKVYGQLRKLVCFKKETDDAEITIKSLAEKSGIGIRKTYQVLNELEFEHHIIKRLNHDTFRHGKTNYFDVSQTYEFFKPVQVLHTPAQNDMGVQTLHTPALSAVVTAQKDIPKEQKSFHKVIKEKQNKEKEKDTVSVFFDTESVKTHINLVLANRNTFVEDEVINQGIFYSYEKNVDKNFDSVNKRINIFLKKVREGQWLIPQGYNEITTQSIRKKEEELEKNKQLQYQEEAQAFRKISGQVIANPGYVKLSDRLAAFRDGLQNANS